MSLNNTAKVVRDFVTNAQKVITVEHNNIHEGVFYEYPEFVDIAAGETHNIGLLTPSDLYMHYRSEKLVANGAEIEIILYEGATISGGTTVSAINHRRVGTPVASEMIVRSDVSISSTGSMIAAGYVPGGTGVGQTRMGGDTTQDNEHVLNTATQYVAVVYNNSEAEVRVFVSPLWYEEEKG